MVILSLLYAYPAFAIAYYLVPDAGKTPVSLLLLFLTFHMLSL